MASGNVSHVIGALNNFDDRTKNKWLKELLLGSTLSWSDIVLIIKMYSCPDEKWKAFECMINNYKPTDDICNSMFDLTNIFLGMNKLINAICPFITENNCLKIEQLLNKIKKITMLIKIKLSHDDGNCCHVETFYECGSYFEEYVDKDICEFLVSKYLPDHCLDKFVQSTQYFKRIKVNNYDRNIILDFTNLSYATKRDVICSFIQMYSTY